MREHWKAFVIVALLSFATGTLVGDKVWIRLWNEVVTFNPTAKPPPYVSTSPDPTMRPGPTDTDNHIKRQ